MFTSEMADVGRVAFPEFRGVRVMMMPVRLEDPRTVPFPQWEAAFEHLVSLAPARRGVAYLTIDEAEVDEGRTHRRPGLHVDGIGPDGREAAWGGGGGYGAKGMLLASDVFGCLGYPGTFDGYPHANGDCEHLREDVVDEPAFPMLAGRVYHCGPLALHEAIPMTRKTRRTFVRLSMPNDCPWYEGYSRNPLGVEPTGPVHPARADFMAYRPTV